MRVHGPGADVGDDAVAGRADQRPRGDEDGSHKICRRNGATTPAITRIAGRTHESVYMAPAYPAHAPPKPHPSFPPIMTVRS